MTKAPDLWPRAAVTLALLFGMNLLDYIDRNILAAVLPQIFSPGAVNKHARHQKRRSLTVQRRLTIKICMQRHVRCCCNDDNQCHRADGPQTRARRPSSQEYRQRQDDAQTGR